MRGPSAFGVCAQRLWHVALDICHPCALFDCVVFRAFPHVATRGFPFINSSEGGACQTRLGPPGVQCSAGVWVSALFGATASVRAACGCAHATGRRVACSLDMHYTRVALAFIPTAMAGSGGGAALCSSPACGGVGRPGKDRFLSVLFLGSLQKDEAGWEFVPGMPPMCSRGTEFRSESAGYPCATQYDPLLAHLKLSRNQCWIDSSQSVASHNFGDSVTSVPSQCPPVGSVASRDSRTKAPESCCNFMH